jgi:hypothetical protein
MEEKWKALRQRVRHKPKGRYGGNMRFGIARRHNWKATICMAHTVTSVSLNATNKQTNIKIGCGS